MTSVDGIINYQKKSDDDLYAIVGCDETATVEQIIAEYKVRALQYHPDKNDGDKDLEAKFQQLKEAKEILCDPEKRANYDKWRNSGISIGYKQWLGMKEHVHQSMHWATMKTKDRMLPDPEGGESSPNVSSTTSRRASEGGANIHWGGRGNVQWDSKAPNEVVSKFRNYEI
uniref:J domain-containing protein n=1 Tax=Clastoptera arizonana TaxID=38151 RepID=A0A1B6DPJ5_9HEMI